MKIMDFIAEKPGITINALHKTVGISTTSIENNLRILKEKQLLYRFGGARKGKWVIIDKLGERLGGK